MLRIILWLQNRNLIIDEVNVVRNITERNYAQLLQPLNYDQYAPFPYLWIVKSLSLFFGFDELPMRFPSLLFGVASLFLFYKLLQKLLKPEYISYPLIYLAVSFTFVLYSASVKQYSGDLFFGLLLCYYAVVVPAPTSVSQHLKLLGTGIISVLCSMPALIIFPAVMISLLFKYPQHRKPLLLTGSVWLVFGGMYYLFVLSPLVHQSNLQHAHAEYFLHLLPRNLSEWEHNYHAFFTLLDAPTGYTLLANIFHLALLILGIRELRKFNPPLLALFVVPVLTTLLLAALHRYSLAQRLLQFLFPFVLVLIGFGLQGLFRFRMAYPRATLITLLSIMGVCIFNQLPLHLFSQKYEVHSITDGLDFIQQQGIQPQQVYLYHSNNDSYLYYTEIHSGRKKYESLKGMNPTRWNLSYDQIAVQPKDTAYLLSTGNISPYDQEKISRELNSKFQVTTTFQNPYAAVMAFTPK